MMTAPQPSILMLAGPTASGKSALALSIADLFAKNKQPVTIINADSKQVYRDLRILSARPTFSEEKRHPHQLFGYLSASEICSAGSWLTSAIAAIRQSRELGHIPLLVGGTGLYLRCLMEGLSAIPAIPDAIHQKGIQLLKEQGIEQFRSQLYMADPTLEAHLDPHNPMRLLRAWEVLEYTGESITVWQSRTPPPPFPREQFRFAALVPNGEEGRKWLYDRIDMRVHQMLEEGALDEVRNLLGKELDPTLPAMRTVGMRGFGAHLSGEMSLEDAISLTQQETRNYAKRQLTWLRRQTPDAFVINPLDKKMSSKFHEFITSAY